MAASRRQFIESLQARKHRAGLISLASASMGPFAAAAGPSAEKFLGLGAFGFRQAVKDASRQTVYTQGTSLKKGLSDRAKAIVAGAKEEGRDLKACMKLEAVYTTTRQDRDGDVLESKGAKIDPAMPLLLYHNACLPIGRHLGVVKQDSSLVKGVAAIADTPLGNDAAALVEFDALRISHGFNPITFEPLEDDNARGFPGWHVKEYEMCEVSLVSIPSNVEAIVTAWSRKKLTTPVLRSWAKSLYEKRSAVASSGWKGGTKTTSNGRVQVTLNVNGETARKGKDSISRLESLVERSLSAIKSKSEAGTSDEDDEDKEEEEEEAKGGGMDEGGSLLEGMRGELQDMMDSGALDDEHSSRVYDLIMRVSEAIGAERAAGAAAGKDDEADMFDRSADEEEEDEGGEDKRRPFGMDEEEEEDEEKNGPGCRAEDDDEEEKSGMDDEDDEYKGAQPGWDGEEEDENVGLNGPPKNAAGSDVSDAAEYLAMQLAAGVTLPAGVATRLKAALED